MRTHFVAEPHRQRIDARKDPVVPGPHVEIGHLRNARQCGAGIDRIGAHHEDEVAIDASEIVVAAGRCRLRRAKPTVSWIDYYSSVSGPPRLGVVIRTVSYSVTRTTPGTGSSTTSMIVSSMTGTLCLPTFLGAFFAEVFRGRFFGVARFATFLREDLALAFPRFEAFSRVVTLAMAVSCKDYRRAIDKDYPSVIRHATFISRPQSDFATAEDAL